MSWSYRSGLPIVAILHTFGLAANDGVYLSNGGVFHPVKETTVQLHREFLSFTCREKQAQVDVRFEFFNPEPVSRTLSVGFQAPTASDISPQGVINNQIRDFRVMQEGRLLPYRLMAATCEDCPLQDTTVLRFDFDQGGVFVYLFDLTFEPGINVVQHSYTFPASHGVWDEQNYAYILRTGGKWAGGRIGELEVEIDMGPGTNFIVNDIFGPKAESSIIGTGYVYATELYGERAMVARILSGRLRIHVQDLDPQENLYFGIESSLCFTGYHGAKDIMPEYWVQALCERSLDLGSLTSVNEWTKQELRLLRNAIYAQYGLAFRDEEMKTLFQRFPWYVPDPNLRLSNIQLTPGEERFIAEILEAEKAATR